MSHERSDRILSKQCYEYCTYVVREEEADMYRKSGVEDLLVIPEGEVFDFMTTLYWIIEHTPEDVIFVSDDDIYTYMYRTKESVRLNLKDGTPDKEVITSEIERVAQMLVDLDLGFATETATPSSYNYDAEFGFKTMPGHIRWINKKALKATLEKDAPTSSDIDLVMQELLKNRVILCPKYLCSYTKGMDNNTGNAEDRQFHEDLQIAMHNKWGRYYTYDFRKNIPHINVVR